MNLEIGDLVQVPLSFDVGVILLIKKHRDLSYHNGEEELAEVYWQNMGRSRLEMTRDLIKINQ